MFWVLLAEPKKVPPEAKAVTVWADAAILAVVSVNCPTGIPAADAPGALKVPTVSIATAWVDASTIFFW